MPSILKEVKETVSYWWLFLLSGIILIAVAIWIFTSPANAYVSLSILFGAAILITGIFETVFAITLRKSIDGWGWTLASGLLHLVIGVYLLSFPAITMAVLPIILGFWLLFMGFAAIGFAIDMRSYGSRDWGWLLAIAIAIIFFGFMVLEVPAFGIAKIVVWSGLSFLFAGIYRIVLSLRLRRFRRGATEFRTRSPFAHS